MHMEMPNPANKQSTQEVPVDTGFVSAKMQVTGVDCTTTGQAPPSCETNYYCVDGRSGTSQTCCCNVDP